jgi:sugar lactone lactonase YvrE
MTMPSARWMWMGTFCLALLALSGVAAGAGQVFGDGQVLAPISPEAGFCAGQPGCNGGFPEGVAIAKSRLYVAGPATFGTAGKGPSVVTVLHRANGNLITEIPIQGETLAFEHAISGLAVDGDERVYVLSTQLGVLRLERHGNTYTQTVYAPPFPDVPFAPTGPDLPPLPNEMAFDDAGFLYVTDSLQATIFRIPPGGGPAAVWFQSPLLAGSLAAPLPFGANGIRVSPGRDFVYVVVTFDAMDPSQGHVYRLPLVNAPGPADIELVHTFHGFVVPDSLVFGAAGKLYVSLAGSNQIAVLDAGGAEITRISGPSGSAIPFDAPATMAFDHAKKSLLVANHAIFGDPAHFAVLRVFVADPGNPLPAPDIP